MKKLLLSALVAASFFGFTSCSKSYTCECHQGTTMVGTTTISNTSKSVAQEDCDKFKSSLQSRYPGTTCTFK